MFCRLLIWCWTGWHWWFNFYRFLVNDELEAETLEKLMENKAVKEKKAELEKKLEMLKKKYEKVITISGNFSRWKEIFENYYLFAGEAPSTRKQIVGIG